MSEILYGYVLEELGYSKLKVLSFKISNQIPIEKIVILRGKIRKKFKNSSLRVRPKDYVILNYFAINIEPYFVEKKLNVNEKIELSKLVDLDKIETYEGLSDI